MVDLVSQYEKIKTEMDAAISEVIHSSRFINGQAVKTFQAELEKYLGVKHVIPCANGTDALQIAMMALGLQRGDEVITANFTFAATVEVIAFLGLVPVLVDVDAGTFNINAKEIEKAITPKTKAIIPVHLFGQCADMEKIISIAKKNNLYVIEDSAQAIGADYIFSDGKKKKAGTIAHIGTTSFFPSKNLGAYGDAGALFTNDDELAKKCRMICNHGMSTQYYYEMLGVNSRLDSIQAAILNVKLKYLDNYATARNKVADYYDKAFANHPKIKTPARIKNSTHVFHQYTLTLNGIDRDKLKAHLASKEIPAMIYYPVALHSQPAYRNKINEGKKYPVTEKLCASVISLPMHTELDDDTLKYISDSVLEFCK
ncbi:MAG: DegT/DnrJ/EryC1/StrS family aminotransferase [Bacteroidetes bacterium]|nr:DegT/DnrJ/EryC1/StrS family aminotransferase [Bacteroidota bacterium]